MSVLSFRLLSPDDLPLLHDWLCRPHVALWWGLAPTRSEVERDYLPMTDASARTRGHVALWGERPVGFVQSYHVMGSGGGWWPDETDPGARGIDVFLAHADELGRGLGATLVRSFVDQLFGDPAVSRVQTDPAPENVRAIRCYEHAGFVSRGEVLTPDGPSVWMVRERSAALPEPDGQTVLLTDAL